MRQKTIVMRLYVTETLRWLRHLVNMFSDSQDRPQSTVIVREIRASKWEK